MSLFHFLNNLFHRHSSFRLCKHLYDSRLSLSRYCHKRPFICVCRLIQNNVADFFLSVFFITLSLFMVTWCKCLVRTANRTNSLCNSTTYAYLFFHTTFNFRNQICVFFTSRQVCFCYQTSIRFSKGSHFSFHSFHCCIINTRRLITCFHIVVKNACFS